MITMETKIPTIPSNNTSEKRRKVKRVIKRETDMANINYLKFAFVSNIPVFIYWFFSATNSA